MNNCSTCGKKLNEDELNRVKFTSCDEYFCNNCYSEIVKESIEDTKGKFFSVKFVKKDGTIRRMTARIGVKKGINGNGHSLKEETKKQVIRVYDMAKLAWRTVTFEKVFDFKCSAVGDFKLY